MNVYSVKNNPALCENVKLYCLKNWNKIYKSFAQDADKSAVADNLPQTWVIAENNGERIFGFCQLIEHEELIGSKDLSPFIASIYVDDEVRNYGCGEMLLNHAKYEAARLGYEKVYIATDHIGYYEKYGFREIGMDVYTWGRAAKVYEAYTCSDIRFELYHRGKPVPDHISLERAKSFWGEPEGNPSKLLWHLKYCTPLVNNPAEWFSVAAFAENQLVGWVNFMQEPEKPLNWYLGDLAVIPEFRRKGIAKRMVKTGIDMISSKASGGERICAYIEKDNKPSLSLFASLSFMDMGELLPFWKLDFGDNETAHMLFLNDKLTVKSGETDYKAVSRLYGGNIEALHGEKISDEEWQRLLSCGDKDEEHFLIYKGSIPAAWLKVNGLDNRETGWISMLSVDGRFQKMGIGGFAVNFAEDFLRLRGKKKVCICTTEDNIAAVKLYKKCGFDAAEKRELKNGDGVKRKGVIFEKVIL